MWKLVYGSVRGTSHVRSEQPCQDFCSGVVVGATVVAACSDGAGSADLSQNGSQAAVERFLEEATRAPLVTAPTKELMLSWADAARGSVLAAAEAHAATPRRLACTLLGALVGAGWAAFLQIGDGVIVFGGDFGYELVFWPDNGEYANTTRFLTDADYRDHLRIEIIERPISELAVLTDGLQMLALDFGLLKVHDPFFTPLFKTVRYGPDERTLEASLRAFLDSKRVNDRTDDDKSLLLATRNVPDVSNPPDAIP